MGQINQIRTQIAKLVDKFYSAGSTKEKFIPGKTPIRYTDRGYDEKEIQAAVETSLDFWLTEGRFTRQFQTELASMIGVKHVLLANSGSSTNLLALSAPTLKI